MKIEFCSWLHAFDFQVCLKTETPTKTEVRQGNGMLI